MKQKKGRKTIKKNIYFCDSKEGKTFFAKTGNRYRKRKKFQDPKKNGNK